jgi:hypothetical protein
MRKEEGKMCRNEEGKVCRKGEEKRKVGSPPQLSVGAVQCVCASEYDDAREALALSPHRDVHRRGLVTRLSRGRPQLQHRRVIAHVEHVRVGAQHRRGARSRRDRVQADHGVEVRRHERADTNRGSLPASATRR